MNTRTVKVPPHLEHLHPALRLWADGRASWTELHEKMSLEDVINANEYLDAWYAAQATPSK